MQAKRETLFGDADKPRRDKRRISFFATKKIFNNKKQG